MTIVLQRSLIMIYRQLLTIIYQNENYILYKIRASFTFTVRDAPIIYFLLLLLIYLFLIESNVRIL